MKRIKPVIHEPSINRIVGSELSLILHDKANFIDAINEVDKIIEQGLPSARLWRSPLHGLQSG
jgi:hypothetical protein